MKETDDFETIADHCIDVGAVIDEGDTRVVFSLSGDSAKEYLQTLNNRARVISPNCTMSENSRTDNGKPIIEAMFEFDYTAEKLIFELQSM